jgi:predicted Zn-dependent protease
MIEDPRRHHFHSSSPPLFSDIVKTFRALAPAVDFWSLRLVEQRLERITVRQNQAEPPVNRHSLGAHITIFDGGGAGYAATCDLSRFGLSAALRRATDWAHTTADVHLIGHEERSMPRHSGQHRSTIEEPWDSLSLQDKQDLLLRLNQRLKAHDAIIDWWAGLEYSSSTVRLITPNVDIDQFFAYITPSLAAVANREAETQMRSYGSDNTAQAGLEHLSRIEFEEAAGWVAEEAVALLDCPNCPSGARDLLLMPNQMALQIHESIGHPLELDRILGDERNYAGTSFVTPEMFGTYRYGSDLLNVTFDPTQPNQIASYRHDDEGAVATHKLLIKDGILQRPLGGMTSQRRAGLEGVANSRSCSWNRPAIDRMANINLEPGTTSLEQMVAAVERGVLMDTNRSWSIDDSRNKFQFGCEIGWLIEHGERKGIVKNPNYRGISATFWRNLKAVGDASHRAVLGVSTCGKGEPNQAIAVGHASPPCLFEAVDVFGGVS